MKKPCTVFLKWFNTFLEEKRLTYSLYEFDVNGTTHFMDSETVIDLIKRADFAEQDFIKLQIVKIDFLNGDIHHFFKHLAKCYVQTHG